MAIPGRLASAGRVKLGAGAAMRKDDGMERKNRE